MISCFFATKMTYMPGTAKQDIAKMVESSKLQNMIFKQICAQKSSDMVHLKALDLYFLFLKLTSMPVQFPSICVFIYLEIGKLPFLWIYGWM